MHTTGFLIANLKIKWMLKAWSQVGGRKDCRGVCFASHCERIVRVGTNIPKPKHYHPVVDS